MAVDVSRPTFQRDLRKLPPAIRKEAAARIADLLKHPIPSALRFHRLDGYKPHVHTIDVTSNKAYKVSFHIIAGVAVMRRVGTHKSIDRCPE